MGEQIMVGGDRGRGAATSPSWARVGGPLAPYAEGFRGELERLGYTPLSSAAHVRLMAHLSRWLGRQCLEAPALTPATADATSPNVGRPATTTPLRASRSSRWWITCSDQGCWPTRRPSRRWRRRRRKRCRSATGGICCWSGVWPPRRLM